MFPIGLNLFCVWRVDTSRQKSKIITNDFTGACYCKTVTQESFSFSFLFLIELREVTKGEGKHWYSDSLLKCEYGDATYNQWRAAGRTSLMQQWNSSSLFSINLKGKRSTFKEPDWPREQMFFAHWVDIYSRESRLVRWAQFALFCIVKSRHNKVQRSQSEPLAGKVMSQKSIYLEQTALNYLLCWFKLQWRTSVSPLWKLLHKHLSIRLWHHGPCNAPVCWGLSLMTGAYSHYCCWKHIFAKMHHYQCDIMEITACEVVWRGLKCNGRLFT